jgi:hypothetical protein
MRKNNGAMRRMRDTKLDNEVRPIWTMSLGLLQSGEAVLLFSTKSNGNSMKYMAYTYHTEFRLWIHCLDEEMNITNEFVVRKRAEMTVSTSKSDIVILGPPGLFALFCMPTTCNLLINPALKSIHIHPGRAPPSTGKIHLFIISLGCNYQWDR